MEKLITKEKKMNRKIIPSLMLSGCLAMTACLAVPAFPAQASQEIYHISEDDSPVEYHSPEEIRDLSLIHIYPGDPHLVCPGRDHDPGGSLRTRKCTPGSRRNNAWLYLARSLPHPERSG